MDITAGDTVAFTYGVICPEANMHTVQLNRSEHLDFRSTGVEFTSHSCDPNCRLSVGKDAVGAFVSLVALIDIKSGQVILVRLI